MSPIGLDFWRDILDDTLWLTLLAAILLALFGPSLWWLVPALVFPFQLGAAIGLDMRADQIRELNWKLPQEGNCLVGFEPCSECFGTGGIRLLGLWVRRCMQCHWQGQIPVKGFRPPRPDES